jgi:hypothetical protein
MNDSWVSKTNEKSILQQTPYLLFYERVMDVKKEVKNKQNLEPYKNEKIVEIKKEINKNEQLQVNQISKEIGLENKNEVRKIEKREEQKPEIINNDTNKKENQNKFDNFNVLNQKIEKTEKIVESKCDPPHQKMEIDDTPYQSKHIENNSLIETENKFDVEKHSIPFNFLSRRRMKIKKIVALLKNSKFNSNKEICEKETKKIKVKDCQIPIDTSLSLREDENISVSQKKPIETKKSNENQKNPKIEKNKLENVKTKPGNFKPLMPNKPTYPSSSTIHNRNLTGLYGSDKIELWETEDDTDLLREQIKFIKSVDGFKESKVVEKDEYDVEYDTGKLKKVKDKENSRNGNHYNYNVFQKVHNQQTNGDVSKDNNQQGQYGRRSNSSDRDNKFKHGKHGHHGHNGQRSNSNFKNKFNKFSQKPQGGKFFKKKF